MMNRIYGVFLCWFVGLGLSGCEGPPPAPPTQFCSIAANCIQFQAVAVTPATCPDPDGTNTRAEWVIRIVGNLPPGKTIDVTYIRHKRFTDGKDAGDDPPETVNVNQANVPVQLGCALAREGGITSPVLSITFEQVCATFHGDPCPKFAKRREKDFGEICTTIFGNGEYANAFRQLGRIVYDTKSYPIDEALFAQVFTPNTPIQCSRNPIFLSKDGTFYNDGNSCTIQFGATQNAVDYSGLLNLPPTISGKRVTSSSNTSQFSFVTGRSPIISFFENKQLYRDYSGEVASVKIDNHYLSLDIASVSGKNVCLKYDYLRAPQ